MTVGELIDELTRYDRELNVVTAGLRAPELVQVHDRLVLKEVNLVPVRPEKALELGTPALEAI